MPPIRCAAVFAGALLVGATACGSTGITAKRVDDSIAPTFANLYVLQQAQSGNTVGVSTLHPAATCARGDQSTPDRGAGEDWICQLQWDRPGSAGPIVATYSVHVRTNGCYTAEGDGPADVNGSPSITTHTGDVVVNPLYKFDGCFDTT
jgi:hypothetical protein